MRKVFYLLGLLSLISLNSKAVFYQVTAGNGGNQTLGGVTVNVAGLNGPITGGYCGAAPYVTGVNHHYDGWRYTFSTGVTHIRIQITKLDQADSVRVKVNGTTYNLTTANLSAFGGTCSATGGAIITNGMVGCSVSSPLGAGTQVDLQAGPSVPITQVDVEHDGTSLASDGVYFNFWFQNDSCQQTFQITADSPRCAGRDIQLHATPFPNTTFSWTGPNGFTATGSDPTLSLNIITSPGTYTCNATRGGCNYSASFNLSVDLTPSKPLVSQKGPKCPGQTDTIDAKSTLGGGGYYQWFNGPLGYNDTGQSKELTNLTSSMAGFYYVYAVSTNGCISDTATLAFQISPEAIADFTYNTKLGCKADTIQFTNGSTGNTFNNWDLGDGTSSTDVDPYHIYFDSVQPIAYTVTLIARNNVCADTITKQIAFNHPLESIFTVDVDSICQHNFIQFTNSSVYPPATTPGYLWNFGDGSPTRDSFNVTYMYDRFGEYDAYLVTTDYLGCHDTSWHHIVVDSTGAIVFAPGDSNLCAGQVIQFSGYYNPTYNVLATWDLGDNNKVYNTANVSHAYDQSGTYKINFSAKYRLCPDTTFSQEIVVKPYPVVDLGHDTAMCPNGEPIRLTDYLNTGNPNIKWRWNTPTKDSTDAIYVYHPGRYSVTASLDGCSITDSVEVFKNCYIDIPNVFTPNGDGSNDYFLPRQLLSKNITKFNMTIFNRWGSIVFQTNSTNGRGWDGKFNDQDQPNGVYIYLIEAYFGNGDNEKYQGNVTLLR